MVWISLLFTIFCLEAAELPKLLTKHANETLRFISMDGRIAYVEKRPGVLGLVNNFRSTDFLSESSGSDFLVKSSRFKQRILIEVIPHMHSELNLLKNHTIKTVPWAGTKVEVLGEGRGAKLHLEDEWASFYDRF